MKKYCLSSVAFLCFLFTSFYSKGQCGSFTTVAGTSTTSTSYGGDGSPATATSVTGVSRVCQDNHGNIYFSDGASVRKIDASTTVITTVAGNGAPGFSGDGGPAVSAQINGGYGAICTDNFGNLYIAEPDNHDVRKVNLSTGMITTIAGMPDGIMTSGYPPACYGWLDKPDGVYVDSTGNLYITDVWQGIVAQTDTGGTYLSIVAGTSYVFSHTGDGGAAVAATLLSPTYITGDKYGNIYFVDAGEVYAGICIRKINTSGIITNVAGSYNFSTNYYVNATPPNINEYGGDGGPATASILGASSLAVDTSGNLYIGTPYNSVRKIDIATGNIHTIAGTCGSGINLSFVAQSGEIIGISTSGTLIQKISGSNSEVTTTSATDSLMTTPYTLPSTFAFGLSAGIAGTPGSTDSASVHVDYGDGHTANFEVPYYNTGSGYAFGPTNNWIPGHTYTYPGRYLVTMTATTLGGFTDYFTPPPPLVGTVNDSNITEVRLFSIEDSVITGPCTFPANARVRVNGGFVGSPSVYDSLYVKIDYGDGTSDYHVIRIDTTAGTVVTSGVRYFKYGYTSYHNYSSTGSYMPTCETVTNTGQHSSNEGHIDYSTFNFFPTIRLDTCGLAGSVTSTVVTHDATTTYCTVPYTATLDVSGLYHGASDTTHAIEAFYVNFGDGSDDTVYASPHADGYGYYSCLAATSHTYTIPGAFTVAVRKLDSATVVTGPTITIGTSCSRVSGVLYRDINANCTADSGETRLKFWPIAVINNTLHDTTYTWCDSNGHYTANLADSNTYSIMPDYFGAFGYGGDSLTLSCPSSGGYTVTPITGSTYSQDFGFTCHGAPDTLDMQVAGWGYGIIPGDTGVVAVWASNPWGYMCDSLSATVTLTIDANLTYLGMWAGPAPTTIAGHTLSWVFSTTHDLMDFRGDVKVRCSTTVTVGDTIHNTVHVTPTYLPDPDSTNNTYTWSQPVRSSWDPNEKEVSPVGYGAQGYIPEGTALSYLVHFQNTGTASARNIVVVDTISNEMDIATLQLISASANVNMVQVSSHVMKFVFNDIYLPDSGTDLAGSKGYVSFNILPKPNRSAGTQIRNHANIYFDYNPAVVTNSTLNTIEDTIGVISGADSVCVGSSITLANHISGGTWTSSNGHASVAGGVVTGVSSGVDTITYTVYDQLSATKIVRITSPVSAGTISGSTTVTVGATSTLSSTISGGTWSSSAPSVATVSATGVVTGLSVGSAVISYSVTGSCGTAVASRMMLVSSSSTCSALGYPDYGGRIFHTDTTFMPFNVDTADVTRHYSSTAVFSWHFSDSTTYTGYTITRPFTGNRNMMTSPYFSYTLTVSDTATGCSASYIDTSWEYPAVFNCSYFPTAISQGDGGSGFSSPVDFGTTSNVYVAPNLGIPSDFNTQVITHWGTGDSSILSPATTDVLGNVLSFMTTPYTYTYAGSYRVGSVVVITNPYDHHSCPALSVTDAIRISGIITHPVITAPISVCEGDTIRLVAHDTTMWHHNFYGGYDTAGVSGFFDLRGAYGTYYTWVINGPAIDSYFLSDPYSVPSIYFHGALESDNDSVMIIANASASDSQFVFLRSDGNQVALDTIRISIMRTTLPPISGLATMCVGTTYTFTDSVSGGTWETTDASVASINSTGVVTAVSAGSVLIKYHSGSSSCPAVFTLNVGTGTLLLPYVTGTSSICQGATTTFTDTITAGTWSSSNTAIASVSASGVVTGLSTGTVTITHSVTNGCGSFVSTSVITITPLPSAGTLSGTTTGSIGSSTAFSSTVAGGTWSSSAPSVATVSATGVVTGLSVGSAVISYAVTGSCGTAVASRTMLVSSSSTCGVHGVGLSAITGTVTMVYHTDTTFAAFSIDTITTAYRYSPTAVFTWAFSDSQTYTGFTVTRPFTGNRITTPTFSYTVTVSDTAIGCFAADTETTDYPWVYNCSYFSAPSLTDIGGASTGIASCGLFSSVPGGPFNPLTPTMDAAYYGFPFYSTMQIFWGDNDSAYATELAGDRTPDFVFMHTYSHAGYYRMHYTFTIYNPYDGSVCTRYSPVNGLYIDGYVNHPVLSGTMTVCEGDTIRLSAHDTTSGLNSFIYGGDTTGVSSFYSVFTGVATPYYGWLRNAPGVDSGSWIGIASAASISVQDSTVIIPHATAEDSEYVFFRYNNCNYTSDTFRIHILRSSLPAISGMATMCVGTTYAFTDSVTGGSWETTDPSVASINAGTGVVTAVGTGSVLIKYHSGSSSCPAVFTLNVGTGTLLSPYVTGASSICQGATTTFTDTITGGTWSSSNTAIATVSVSGVVTGLSAGTATITHTVTNGCGSFVGASVITINPLPSAGTLSGTTTVCAGSTTTITPTVTGGTWSTSATSIASVAGGTVTGVTSGRATISYSVTNSCGTDVATDTITVNPLPSAGTLSGTTTVCVGASTTITSTVTGGTWSTSAASTASVSGGVVTGASAGTVIVSYSVTNSCGTVIAADTITVNPLPSAGTITGADSVCIGSTITLGTTGSSSTSSSWALSNSSATLSGTVLTGAISGADTVTYTATNSCGTRSVTKIITIMPLPDPGTLAGADSVCAGSSITLTETVTGGTWSISGTSATVAAGVVHGVAAGTSTVTYTVTNYCGTGIRVHPVITNPLPVAGTLSGTATICVGTTTTITPTVTGGIWSSSIISTATVDASGVVTGVAAGLVNISYTVTNSCGTDVATIAITINPLPVAGSISGPDSVCIGDSITLTDGAISGVWSSANTSVASVSATGAVTGVSNGTVTISYTVAIACGTAAATHSVYVKSVADCNTGVTSPLPSEASEAIHVYPNPNNGSFIVAIPAYSTNVAVVVTDITGKVITEIYPKNASGQKVPVQLNNVASGTYLLKVSIDGSLYYDKITVW